MNYLQVMYLICAFVLLPLVGCKQDDFAFTYNSTNTPKGTFEFVGLTETQYSRTSQVTLKLETTMPFEMAFFVDEDCAYKKVTKWEPYSETKTLQLPAEDGEHIVHVIYRNQNHFHSECKSAKLILDRTAPVLNKVKLSERVSSTLTTPNFKLQIATDAHSPIAKYEARLLNAGNDAEVLGWMEVTPSSSQTLTAAMASGSAYYIEVRAYDKAGNVTAAKRSDSFYAGLTVDFGYLEQGDENAFVSCVTTPCRLRSGVYLIQGRLNFALPEDIDVQYHTEDFTAFAGLDYFAKNGTTKLLAGQTNFSFLLNVKESEIPGPERRFKVIAQHSLSAQPHEMGIKNLNFDNGLYTKAVTQPAFKYFKNFGNDTLFNCGLSVSDELYCWGKLWDGTDSGLGRKIDTNGLVFRSLGAQATVLCGVATDDKVYCIGERTSSSPIINDLPEGLHTQFQALSDFQNVKEIALTSNTLCAVLHDGTIRCSGSRVYTALGNDNATGTWNNVVGFSNVGVDPVATQISSFLSGFCALTTAGDVYCWSSSNNSYEAGTTGPTTQPVKVAGLPASKFIAGGSSTNCAVTTDGRVFCWGYGLFGLLGSSTTADKSATPVEVQGLSNIETMSMSWGACAIQNLSSVKKLLCWGSNSNGNLGFKDEGNYLSPEENTLLSENVESLSFEGGHCALTSSGKIYCWGYGGTGMGNYGHSVPSTTDADGGFSNTYFLTTHPEFTSSTQNPIMAESRTCAQDDEGYYTCAARPGIYVERPHFHPLQRTRVTPEPALGLSFGTNSEFYCYIGLDKKVSCKGQNDQGQLGIGNFLDSDTYRKINSLSDVKTIKSGKHHTCALTENNKVYCWGLNYSGQSGTSNGTDFRNTPNLISLPTGNIISLAVAAYTNCVLYSNGRTYCWGNATNGELGTGSTQSTGTPALVSNSLNFKSLYANPETMIFCGIDSSNDLYCWGQGSSISTPYWANRSLVPLQEGIGKKYVSVAFTDYDIVAQSTDGKIYTWGYQSNGTGSRDMWGTMRKAPTDPVMNLAGGVDKILASDYLGKIYCVSIKLDGQYQDIKCWNRRITNVGLQPRQLFVAQ